MNLKLVVCMPAFFACALVMGCGGMQQARTVEAAEHANMDGAVKDMATTPYVEFMGDSQIQGLVAYANNGLWKCTTCAQGQTSTQVLAEVPQVAALKPDVVVVLTGAYDLVDNPDNAHAEPTVSNYDQIEQAFAAAKIPVVICTLPNSTVYDNYWTDEGMELENYSGVLNNVISFQGSQFPTSGMDFTHAGLAAAYPVVYQAVESFHVGQTR
jgi:hypothetical protein